ncbi:MAG: hypothetical protein M3N82_01295 [Pseudomonadota bacterium]|nr:hypothetical protein [Pseudomonadota bacterium]
MTLPTNFSTIADDVPNQIAIARHAAKKFLEVLAASLTVGGLDATLQIEGERISLTGFEHKAQATRRFVLRPAKNPGHNGEQEGIVEYVFRVGQVDDAIEVARLYLQSDWIATEDPEGKEVLVAFGEPNQLPGATSRAVISHVLHGILKSSLFRPLPAVQ